MAAKAAAKKPATHPPFYEMVSDAILTLKERSGSSQYAIQKFSEEKYKQLPLNFRKQLLTQLKKFAASGKVVKVKNSYKLPATAKPAAVPKKPTVKKAAVTKTKTAAKPKSTASKPKAVAAKGKDVKPKAKPAKAAKKVSAPVKKTPKKIKRLSSVKSPAKRMSARKK